MFTDTTIFSAQTLGTVVNALGIAVPLVIFAAQLGTNREPFFRYWSASYVFLLASILGDGVNQAHGSPLLGSFGIFVAYALSSACMIRTASALVGGPPRWGWLVGGSLAMLAAAGALLAAGRAFPIAATPVVLVNLAAHVMLGLAILRTWRMGDNRSGGLLGVWMIVTGLWALAFPVLEQYHLLWIGYMVAGVNHTIVGTGMAVFLLDVAARRLEAQHQELQALSRIKTDFIANVSHELRTPLTVIKTGAWVLNGRLTKPEDEMERMVVADLRAQTDNLVALVDSLLDFSKFELGKLEFERRPGDLAQLVQEAVTAYSPVLETKRIKVSVRIPEGLPAIFDAVKLRQVITNVLMNAAKFTPEDGRVWVAVAQEGEAARITIRDSGIGIPADLLQKVFTRFFQADGGRVGKSSGLGLGLSLSKIIVEEGHGGRIWAERPAEGGSQFTILLPLRPA